jgi:hypothetical protein
VVKPARLEDTDDEILPSRGNGLNRMTFGRGADRSPPRRTSSPKRLPGHPSGLGIDGSQNALQQDGAPHEQAA